MHLLITRPKTQAEDLQKILQNLGHTTLLAPLLEISWDHPALNLDTLQAIIVTSQNTVRALRTHPESHKIAKVPFVAVGRGTATAVRSAEFTLAVEGHSGAEDLAANIKNIFTPQRGPLLYARGDVIAFDLEEALRPLGFEIRQSILYRSTPVITLPPLVVDALQKSTVEGVLLMSPQTAKVWCRLVTAAGLTENIRSVVHVCLSKAVAVPLKELPHFSYVVAGEPNLDAFLNLITEVSSSRPTAFSSAP